MGSPKIRIFEARLGQVVVQYSSTVVVVVVVVVVLVVVVVEVLVNSIYTN